MNSLTSKPGLRLMTPHLGMVPVANIPKHVTSLLNTKDESKIRLNMTSRAVVKKQTNKNTVKFTVRRRQIIFALRVISSVDRIVLFAFFRCYSLRCSWTTHRLNHW